MKTYWWKALCVVLLLYTLIAGLLMPVPAKDILNETIRNLHFHVPMWFTMIILFGISCVSSIQYLSSGRLQKDIVAVQSANVGLLFGILGLITGAIWANYTWGAPWSDDIKQLCTAIALLMYFAYFVLRNSFTDLDKRARVSAVYNIFAFAMLFPLLFIIPRMTDSLHPGNGGNPAFSQYDLDNELRKVFYPAVIAWMLLGLWITEIRIRMRMLELKSLLS
ncbi:MAG: cytochrome c biogenesis protein [Thermoflavifilum sp.]|nr:cytochrome c biogenesis protein [Thermoflavifilum sp.]